MRLRSYALSCGHIRGMTGKILAKGDQLSCYDCPRAPRWDSPPPQRQILAELPEVPSHGRR